jgi:hypothetical protein
MKKYILLFAVIFYSVITRAQENKVTISGGYVFTNIEDVDVNANGFRINGLFEYNPMGGKFAHGISVGYIRTNASYTALMLTSDYKITNIPYYYAPKYMFGTESFKGFIKGALGMHSSWYERTGALGTVNDRSWGFYGGAGAGIMKNFGEKVFINVEYEWAYLSNAGYRDGFINTISGGLGFNF